MTSPVPHGEGEGVPTAWLLICRDGVTPGIAYISRESAEEHIGPGESIVPLYSADVPALLARLAAAEKARDEALGALKYIASHRGLTLLGDGTYSDGVHDGWVQLADAADAALKRDGEG